MQWFCRAIKLCIISVKIYTAIMVTVTFEIKSNIWFEQGKKKVLPAARVTFFAMQVIGNKQFFKVCVNFFSWAIKGFYQSSLWNEFDFTNIINVSPNILAKDQNFKKLRHSSVDERTLTTMALICSGHWKTHVPFCLRKERPENTFLTLIMNYHKTAQKNKLCYSKQQ